MLYKLPHVKHRTLDGFLRNGGTVSILLFRGRSVVVSVNVVVSRIFSRVVASRGEKVVVVEEVAVVVVLVVVVVVLVDVIVGSLLSEELDFHDNGIPKGKAGLEG